MRLRDVVGHGIYQSAQAMLTRAMEGESTAFDRLVPGAGGARRWMTIRVVPDAAPSGEVHGAFVLMNDIHGLKQAQEALRASEAELRLIMDNVPARVRTSIAIIAIASSTVTTRTGWARAGRN